MLDRVIPWQRHNQVASNKKLHSINLYRRNKYGLPQKSCNCWFKAIIPVSFSQRLCRNLITTIPSPHCVNNFWCRKIESSATEYHSCNHHSTYPDEKINFMSRNSRNQWKSKTGVAGTLWWQQNQLGSVHLLSPLALHSMHLTARVLLHCVLLHLLSKTSSAMLHRYWSVTLP